jgi:hypothetical protein
MGPDNHHQIRLSPLATPLVLQTPADKLFYSFAMPTRVLRVACTITTQNTVTAAVIALDRRVTYGSDTGRVEVDTVTMPTAAIIGKVVYSPLINQLFVPGEQLVIELVTASTAGAAHIDIIVEEAWEEPLNLASGLVSV